MCCNTFFSYSYFILEYILIQYIQKDKTLPTTLLYIYINLNSILGSIGSKIKVERCIILYNFVLNSFI